MREFPAQGPGPPGATVEFLAEVRGRTVRTQRTGQYMKDGKMAR
jgi:hypothetical protein